MSDKTMTPEDAIGYAADKEAALARDTEYLRIAYENLRECSRRLTEDHGAVVNLWLNTGTVEGGEPFVSGNISVTLVRHLISESIFEGGSNAQAEAVQRNDE